MAMSTHAERVAEFVLSFRLEDVPAGTREKAKQVVLDTLGIALASSTMDFGAIALDIAEALGGEGESQLIGRRRKVAAANAVLANGTLAHGLDYDDTLEEAIVHTGCCGATTALAVGEKVGASGGEVLSAAIAGIEVMCKVGLVVPGSFHRRAFHPTALCAPFGAAAAAGRLLGLEARQLANAFGICGSLSSGIIEYLADGSWTKRLHPGWGAHGGVVAAMLAMKGFTGPLSVFEGEHGFFRAFASEARPDLARLEELGKRWEIPRLTFKSYPCGSISHPYMDCALRIREVHGVRPEQIEEVVCRTAEGPVHRLWEPLAEKRRPATPYGAKFSLPYSIAVILARGKAGLEEFSERWTRDSAVLALAEKVRYEIDPTIDYPRRFSGHVRVRLEDGRVIEENQPHPRGGLEDPLPESEIQSKFRANAALCLSGARAEEILSLIQRLETLPTIGRLADLLAP
jgi:2-methylcitrate dehydratase PrpD